jgi:hypothetical protein
MIYLLLFPNFLVTDLVTYLLTKAIYRGAFAPKNQMGGKNKIKNITERNTSPPCIH